MIPIAAFSNLINGVISGLIALRLAVRYFRHGYDRVTGRGIRYFIWLYLGLTIMWLLYSLPGIVIFDLSTITFTQSLADVFVYVVSACAILVAFYALGRETIGAVLITFIGATAVVYIFGRMFAPFPHVRHIIPPYVYWQADIPAWLAMMTGTVAAICSLVAIIAFAWLGYKARSNATIFRRCLFLAFGMTFLFLASIIFFGFPTGGFFSTMLSSVLGIAGLLCMFIGIPSHDQPQPKAAV